MASMGPGDIKAFPMQAAAVAVGNGTAMVCTDGNGAYTALAMQIVGITSATITFEATLDGTTWVAVQATNLNTGTAATTATADGIYRLTTLGLLQVRARISTYATGTITVTGILAA